MAAVNRRSKRRSKRGSLALIVTIGANDPAFGRGCSFLSCSRYFFSYVKGAIQSLPSSSLVGDWTVGGRLVHVVSSTKLNAEHGAFVVGARVKVKGLQMADGSVVATKVQLRDSN